MWRKPDEPKVSSPLPESTPVSRVEPIRAPGISVPAGPSVAHPPAGGVLTSSLIIKGEITGREDLYIDGEVQGKIRITEAKVTVGPHGRVSADIEAREILVRGNVKGSLLAHERVEIGSTGEVQGDVIARRLTIDDGAVIHGLVEVERKAEPAQPRVVRATGTEDSQPVAVETTGS
jgi:cytoskeletal protein CcmA (bactofilin family)